MIHSTGVLYHEGDFALKGKERLWTIKGLGYMIGQTPIVFTIQMPDASENSYARMIFARCMNALEEQFSLGFSWKIFDDDLQEVPRSSFREFHRT